MMTCAYRSDVKGISVFLNRYRLCATHALGERVADKHHLSCLRRNLCSAAAVAVVTVENAGLSL